MRCVRCVLRSDRHCYYRLQKIARISTRGRRRAHSSQREDARQRRMRGGVEQCAGGAKSDGTAKGASATECAISITSYRVQQSIARWPVAMSMLLQNCGMCLWLLPPQPAQLWRTMRVCSSNGQGVTSATYESDSSVRDAAGEADRLEQRRRVEWQQVAGGTVCTTNQLDAHLLASSSHLPAPLSWASLRRPLTPSALHSILTATPHLQPLQPLPSITAISSCSFCCIPLISFPLLP